MADKKKFDFPSAVRSLLREWAVFSVREARDYEAQGGELPPDWKQSFKDNLSEIVDDIWDSSWVGTPNPRTEPCFVCDGTGVINVSRMFPSVKIQPMKDEPCKVCKGTGKVEA